MAKSGYWLVTLILFALPNYGNESKNITLTKRSKPLMVRHSAKMANDVVYVKQTRYFTELLHLALQKSEIPFTTKAIEIPAVIDSRFALMLEGGMFDVIWLHTNKEREKNLIPIRIPLFKGLIGWRVLVIRRSSESIFKRISSVNKLKKLIAGQGHDWPDTHILRANSFNIVTSVHPSNLYGMMQIKRLDYFPRSILEVQNELILDRNKDLMIEPSLALRYPTAFYFFVTKDNSELAKVIEIGLEKAIKDGSFDKVFYRYFAEDIQRFTFNQRKVFKITTPEISFSHLPLERKELWFNGKDTPF
ncbi:amino acid ABC transporter substrate-binding protein [Paraglaciecola aquimarina]|uniref:Amino acid ABC transporter substrate-binding protein n=1 Tax=Paraglaciecola aquimarina TaxID=1235557 RepID=A0ABU3SVU0_9ALTE|nr:amino acid ABC transporter substrate-binding protein [Paraglaciecola aquimarina]MDU0354108.1 amino acid ABC transporter substrate-binding protein [Paraglaciecola aquimarina]